MIFKNGVVLRQNDFKTEKELQIYFEQNIEQIINCKFIETEFAVGNFRLDSLAFDEELKSFRIIEYKNVKNHSLVDQGYTYLKLLLERKADFVLKYNEKTNLNLKITDIDWSQSRITFVSPIYTKYQLNATDFKNIPVDLIKATRYEDGIINVDFIKKESEIKVDSIQITSDQKEVSKEIVVYTEEDHLSKVNNSTKELYEDLKDRILNLDDIDIDVKKVYIAFKGRKNIVDIEFTRDKLKIDINMKKGTLDDPLNITQDITTIGHWGNGDYRVTISKKEEIDNVIPLIRQSLEINKK